jgi:hypothetical protein
VSGKCPAWKAFAILANCCVAGHGIAQTPAIAAGASSADSAESAPPPAASANLPQVLVSGERDAALGDTVPQIQLDPPDIESIGVSSVAELLDELTAETQSSRGRGDVPPVLLLNGRRISGPAEIHDIPSEAIERIDVLSEDVALRYGYAADQKVVNFVVRQRYRALDAEGEGSVATEGGGEVAKANLNYIRLAGQALLNLDMSYEQDAVLLESQRDLDTIATGSPFDLIGNVTAPGAAAGAEIDPALSALAGETVTVAEVPLLPAGVKPSLADFAANANVARLTDLSPDRSLRPQTRRFHVNAVARRGILGSVYATVNAGVDVVDSRSLQGLASASLLVPAADPFSPFSTAVQVNRYLAELAPLSQQADSVTAHTGFSLDADVRRWTWSVTGSEEHVVSHTSTQTGVDLDPAQALLDVDDPTLDPFTRLPAELLMMRAGEYAQSTSDIGNLQVVANGTVLELPAGPLTTSLDVGEEVSRIESQSSAAGDTQASNLSRNVTRGQMNVEIPLTNRTRGVLGRFGDLTGDINVTAQQVSDFGFIHGMYLGLNWSPSGRLNLAASGVNDEAAPSVQFLSSPTILTPNVPVFDYVRGQTVTVTQLTGGNADLAADHRHLLSLSLNYRPLPKTNLNINAGYVISDTRNLTAPLPAATSAAQAAFPDRYLRDGSGDLIEVDERPVNFAHEDRVQLRWGINGSWPLGSSTDAARAADGRPGEVGAPSGGPANLQIALRDAWFIRDDILIRAGIPELDLLNGGAIGATGGQPRQQISLQAGFTAGWFGARISDRWHGASLVNGGTASGDLTFSALNTASLRLFMNLGDVPAFKDTGWVHGVRVVLSADNAFNEHQNVHDANGDVPLAYQSAYLDPLGRVIRLDLRKVF